MHYELRNLRHLVALMTHQNFSIAAEAVSLSQSAFSRSIQALEHQAGCKLVERDQPGLPPTPQGKLVLSYALEILSKAHELNEKILRINDADRDTLSFGCCPATAAWLVPRALARFIERHPLANTRFVVDVWDNLNKRLEAEEVEFFVTNSRRVELDPTYRIKHLQPRTWCFYCRSDHPLAAVENVTREQLFAYPLACSFGIRNLVQQYSGRREYLPAVECENGRALIDIVLHSNAIGCSSQLKILQESFKPGESLHLLKPIDIPPDLESLEIRDGVISLRRHKLSPLAEIFIEILEEVDSSPPLVGLQSDTIGV